MAVFGYTRVSTERQAQEGESLEAQQRTIQGHAMILGLTVDHIFVERGVSGSKPLRERPEGSALMDRAQAGDTIITPKLDRMFRSALDALDVLASLKKRSVSLHMIDLGGDVTGNGISKLVFTILSAVAEAERERTRERIAEVKADQKARGRYLGGAAPFGWRKGGHTLEPVPEQQEALRAAREMRDEGKSLRAIELEMRRRGIAVSHVTLSKALKPVPRTTDSA